MSGPYVASPLVLYFLDVELPDPNRDMQTPTAGMGYLLKY